MKKMNGFRSDSKLFKLRQRIRFFKFDLELASTEGASVVELSPSSEALTMKIFLAGGAVSQAFFSLIHLSKANHAILIIF